MNTSNRMRQLAWSLSLSLGVVMLSTAWVEARVALPGEAAAPHRVSASRPVTPAVPLPGIRPQSADICERLVDALVEVESAGHPRRVGRQGERGLMQVKAATWAEVTAQLFGRRVSFERAFEPALNRRVGLAYLRQLRTWLAGYREQWRADERTLLLACYNAGPERVREAGFCFERLPASTRDYITRAGALHDVLRREVAVARP